MRPAADAIPHRPPAKWFGFDDRLSELKNLQLASSGTRPGKPLMKPSPDYGWRSVVLGRNNCDE